MYGWVEYGGLKTSELHIQSTEAEVQIFSDPLFHSCCSDWNLPGYVTSPTPTQILMVIFPPACHLHTMYVITLPSSMPPCNLWDISSKKTFILFTLGTRCISYYFHSTKVQPLPLLQQMSKGGLQVNIQHWMKNR